MRVWIVVGLLLAGCLVFAHGAFAQPGTAPALELTIGHAGFVDDATISHLVVGGQARWPVTPRLATSRASAFEAPMTPALAAA